MRKKRTDYQITEGIQCALEREGRFDYAYMPRPKKYLEPTVNYPFRPRGGDKVASVFWRTVLLIAGPVTIRLVYGAKVVGRENLRALERRGAVCVCNHFNYLDTLFVREAVGQYRSYHTMAPWNNRFGIGGRIIRHGGMLPFSADTAVMRKFNAAVGELLKEGKIINFYAEQAMWRNYQKPRPMKDGAFHYAVKFGVPVLPVFCTFKKDGKGRIRRLRINIMPAVYPDETLPRAERIRKMKDGAQTAWKDCYERAYGIPLIYETRERLKKESAP